MVVAVAVVDVAAVLRGALEPEQQPLESRHHQPHQGPATCLLPFRAPLSGYQSNREKERRLKRDRERERETYCVMEKDR